MKAISSNSPATITVHVPMKYTLRGGRKTVLAPTLSIAPRRNFDNALVKALARAYRWRQRIENGEYASITELAKAEGVNQSYACRLLRLTLLAPNSVNAILDGQHNPDLTLTEAAKPFPVEWIKQRGQTCAWLIRQTLFNEERHRNAR